MKKTLFFSALVVLTAGLIFAGCKKDDKDEPDSSKPANEFAAKIAGHFYWGYDYWGGLTRGYHNYCGLDISANGLQAVLTAEGEAPLVLDIEFDENGNITLSGTDNIFFGKVKDLEMKVSDSGDKVTIYGKSNFDEFSIGSGSYYEYRLELDLQPKSQAEQCIDIVNGKTFVAEYKDLGGYREGFYNSADEMKIVFNSDRKTALLTTAGECPMNFNYIADNYGTLTITGINTNTAWTVGNGLTGDWLGNDDLLTPAEYYGTVIINIPSKLPITSAPQRRRNVEYAGAPTNTSNRICVVFQKPYGGSSYQYVYMYEE